MIDFIVRCWKRPEGWESVTDPLDRLRFGAGIKELLVGNQLPILLIDFLGDEAAEDLGWESVTDPLDRLRFNGFIFPGQLGISYRSS